MTGRGGALGHRIEAYRPLVVAEMQAAVGDDPAGLFAWMRYHLGWEDREGRPTDGSPGKLLRPAALMMAAEACGQDLAKAAPAAAAAELVHNFSLLHDDIEDESERRRGRPTVWTFAGTAQAINAGDGMYTIARLALHRLLDAGVDERRVLAAMRELDDACLRLLEGQYLDLSFEGRTEVTHEQYLEMIEGKTAALFCASFAIGAHLAGAPGSAVAALREYGRRVGLAFQAVDDLLGIWGDPAVTGKPVGDDLASRKMTYPVIGALATGAATALEAAYHGPRDEPLDVPALAAAIEAAGGRAATEALAAEQVERALAVLEPLPLGADERVLFEEYAALATAREA